MLVFSFILIFDMGFLFKRLKSVYWIAFIIWWNISYILTNIIFSISYEVQYVFLLIQFILNWARRASREFQLIIICIYFFTHSLLCLFHEHWFLFDKNAWFFTRLLSSYCLFVFTILIFLLSHTFFFISVYIFWNFRSVYLFCVIWDICVFESSCRTIR